MVEGKSQLSPLPCYRQRSARGTFAVRGPFSARPGAALLATSLEAGQ